MTKVKSFLVILIFFVFIVGCTEKKVTKKTDSETSVTEQKNQQTNRPTLFIHGYGGGTGSFGKMINRMEKEGETKKTLILTVTEDGEIKETGKWTNEEDNPSIQVIFEQNKSHEWNQAQWIKNCLTYLNTTYAINEVNLVGHSMGGVSSLRYLTTYSGEKNLPVVHKFAAIAAPFNNFTELPQTETVDSVIENGPSVQSERYSDYVTGIENISKTMPVLLIAGDVEDGSLSDEAVEVTDALSIASLFKAHGNPLEEKIFYGKKAQHSQLHENTEVDQVVADFLWKS